MYQQWPYILYKNTDNLQHICLIHLFLNVLISCCVTLFDHKNSTSPSYPTRGPYRISRHDPIPRTSVQFSCTQIVFISSQHQILVTPNKSHHFTCLEQHTCNFFPPIDPSNYCYVNAREYALYRCIYSTSNK